MTLGLQIGCKLEQKCTHISLKKIVSVHETERQLSVLKMLSIGSHLPALPQAPHSFRCAS